MVCGMPYLSLLGKSVGTSTMLEMPQEGSAKQIVNFWNFDHE